MQPVLLVRREQAVHREATVKPAQLALRVKTVFPSKDPKVKSEQLDLQVKTVLTVPAGSGSKDFKAHKESRAHKEPPVQC